MQQPPIIANKNYARNQKAAKNFLEQNFLRKHLLEYGPNSYIKFSNLEESVTLLIYFVVNAEFDKLNQFILLVEELERSNKTFPSLDYTLATPDTKFTALHIAVSNAIFHLDYDVKIIRLLLEKGGTKQLTLKNTMGGIPLTYTTYPKIYIPRNFLRHSTAESSLQISEQALSIKRQVVTKLLLNDMSEKQLLSGDNNNRIALHNACYFGDVSLVQLFLKTATKAQLFFQDIELKTPLLMAIWSQIESQEQSTISYASFQSLIDSLLLTTYPEQTLKRKDKYEQHALFLLCKHANEIDPQLIIINKLLQLQNRNDQLKMKVCFKFDIANISTPKWLKFADKEPIIEMTALSVTLLSNNDNLFYCLTNYDCSEQYLCGYSPLQLAARNGDVQKVAHLIKNGPITQLRAISSGGGPIHVAHPACIELLLKADPSQINLTDKQGQTSLHVACLKGEYERVKKLITCGARSDIQDNDLYLPLHYACISGNINIIKLLSKDIFHHVLQAGKRGYTPFSLALATSQDNTALYLLELCQDVKHRLCTHQNLHLAMAYCENVVIEKILDAVIDLNAPFCKQHGLTPLHYAYSRCNLEIFQSLLRRGANPLVGNVLGDTVLHLACRDGDLEFIDNLLKNSCIAINQKNLAGNSAVMLAAFYGHISLVEYITHKGANVDQSDIEALQHFRKNLLSYSTDYPVEDINDKFIKINTILQKAIENKKQDLLKKNIITNNQSIKNIETSFLEYSPLEKSVNNQQVNLDNYFEQIGFTEEDLNDMKEEYKYKKALPKMSTKNNKNSFYQEAPRRKEKIFSFLDGRITSESSNIISVRGSSIPMFFYRDERLYSNNCNDKSFSRQENLKLDGHHLKKLDRKKGLIHDLIKLGSDILKVQYTYEWKRNRLNRVLVFEVSSSPSGACLLIPGRELESGLHEHADIKALRESIGVGKVIEIALPSTTSPNSYKEQQKP